MWKLIKAYLCLGMGVSYGEDDEAEAKRTARVRELQAIERQRQRRVMEGEKQNAPAERARGDNQA